MLDDKPLIDSQDRQRIHVQEYDELRDWAARFGVTTQQVKDAIDRVGDRAVEVERYLKGSKP